MGQRLTLTPDGPRELRDLLFERGVEFPCGGRANCGRCRVRVVEGDVAVGAEMRVVLTAAEIEAGWRLGCRAVANGRVVIETGQWEASILSDDVTLEWEPRDGVGVAIDLGTTTLVVQAVDLATGDVRAVRTALNPQAVHGADVMTRIEFELREPGVLKQMIRRKLGAMVAEALGGTAAEEVLLVGNTVMHHLFSGEDVEPLAHAPFETGEGGERRFTARELEWPPAAGAITFLPCLGGFVGSDIAAGMIAAGIPESAEECALIDLGTNGEIVVGSRAGARCASTAAGPAFEAGRIRMGMRAMHGAIDRVWLEGGRLACHTIGGEDPRGICGSGLVDAAAAALDLGVLGANGRLAGAAELPIAGPVALSQRDIRELQLAKGAVAAGFEMLARERPARVHLAGAFGNYVDALSAVRIGLLPQNTSISAAGNTALRGARLLLLNPSRREERVRRVVAATQHVALADSAEFMDRFAAAMMFPERESVARQEQAPSSRS